MTEPKKFLKNIAAAFLMSLVPLISLYAIGFLRYRGESVRVRPGCHTIVIGNSLGACAINDTILANWHNLSKNGAYFIDMAGELDKLLSENSGVDTVVIASGLPAFEGFSDKRYYSRDIQELRVMGKSVFANRNLLCMNLKNPNFIAYLLTTPLEETVMNSYSPFGEYEALERHALFSTATGGTKHYEEVLRKRGTRNHPLEEILSEWSLQTRGLQMLIDVGNRHGVTVVVMNTPLYHITDYIDDHGYKELLKSLKGDFLIADYQDFEFPDTSYYGDVNHLNYQGSVAFSRYLRHNGLQPQKTANKF